MATMTDKEIELLKQQLEEKKKEIDVIYDKLVEAGVVPLPDDFLDEVAGGMTVIYHPAAPSPTPSGRTSFPRTSRVTYFVGADGRVHGRLIKG